MNDKSINQIAEGLEFHTLDELMILLAQNNKVLLAAGEISGYYFSL